MPNQTAYSLHSTCSWFSSKLFWEWIHQRVCVYVCAWVSVCVWYSLCVDMRAGSNEYVCTCQLPVPTSTYPVSCKCSTHVPLGPSQIAANPPILPQPQSLTSRQQTGTLYLLGKPEARYNGAPCSQYIPVYHNEPQCAGSLIGQLWPFGARFLLQKVTQVHFCFCFHCRYSK